jgi:formamidopyrimidine-DNA glycosylase
MPELPEIETLRRQLSHVLRGERIIHVEVFDPKIGPLSGLRGRTVKTVRREGKAIWMDLDGDLSLRLHLRMSGRLLWRKGPAARPTYARFRFCFRAGELLCLDPRRFATAEVRRTETESSGVPDALRMKDALGLEKAARNRRLPVKTFLMDQRIIAGIGNIYACEILYEADVDPCKAAGCVSLQEWRTIAQAMAWVLKIAVRCRGTSISDWRDLHGDRGEFQNHLQVYDRKGQACRRCGGAVRRIVLGGRGTYFCPSCQR